MMKRPRAWLADSKDHQHDSSISKETTSKKKVRCRRHHRRQDVRIVPSISAKHFIIVAPTLLLTGVKGFEVTQQFRSPTRMRFPTVSQFSTSISRTPACMFSTSDSQDADAVMSTGTKDGSLQPPPDLDEDTLKTDSSPLSSFTSSQLVQSTSRVKSSYGLGKLRFQRSHGMFGIVSLPAVVWALYMVHQTTSLDFQHSPVALLLSVSLAVASTAALAISAIPIVQQVPKSTVISKRWNIIPPHKEAFRRTIAIVGYLDLRLTNELVKIGFPIEQQQQHLLVEDWQGWFAKALFVYYLWFFFPRGSFDNGNTWVFVVPMSIGFGLDVYHQAASNWMYWDNSVVTVEYLLFTLLSSQIVAFMFTLGFRNIVPIRYGYWIAAVVVFMLCGGMGVSQLPLLQQQ